MDVLYAQREQREQHDDRLLLIPGDVERQRQLVDRGEFERLRELLRDDDERVAVVALPRVQHARNTADIAKVELVVAIFCAARGRITSYNVCYTKLLRRHPHRGLRKISLQQAQSYNFV